VVVFVCNEGWTRRTTRVPSSSPLSLSSLSSPPLPPPPPPGRGAGGARAGEETQTKTGRRYTRSPHPPPSRPPGQGRGGTHHEPVQAARPDQKDLVQNAHLRRRAVPRGEHLGRRQRRRLVPGGWCAARGRVPVGGGGQHRDRDRPARGRRPHAHGPQSHRPARRGRRPRAPLPPRGRHPRVWRRARRAAAAAPHPLQPGFRRRVWRVVHRARHPPLARPLHPHDAHVHGRMAQPHRGACGGGRKKIVFFTLFFLPPRRPRRPPPPPRSR